MADNVAITAGSGTTIATDDRGGSLGQYQRVLAYPAMAQTQEQASAGLTTASTSYSIGDTLSSGWTFTSMNEASGQTGRITGLRAYDKADVLTSVTFYFAAASITFGTDNSAPGISDADMAKVNGAITVGFADLGGARIATADNLRIPYLCDATSLFVYAVTNTAHTFFGAVGDVPLRLFYEWD